MTIALKRHHRQRLKNNRSFHFGRYLKKIENSMVVNTPTPCSCWMCGNERRYFKKLTMQELKSLDYFKVEMKF
jgi:hypothetical protein